MNPIDAAWFVWVFDPVTGLGIVLDDLASTASALDVQLEEDGAVVQVMPRPYSVMRRVMVFGGKRVRRKVTRVES